MMMASKVLHPGMRYSEGLTLTDGVQGTLGGASGEGDTAKTGRERRRQLLRRRDY